MNFIKKLINLALVFALLLTSFAPYMTSADEDVIDNYSTLSTNVRLDTPVYDSDGNLVDMQGGKRVGAVFNNQPNYLSPSAWNGLLSGGSYTYGTQGSVYAQSWRQVICNDSDATTEERVCPTGYEENSSGLCVTTKTLTEEKICPDGSLEDEDGNCIKNITTSTQTPTCPTGYTLSSDGTTCTKAATYSCPTGYTLSGTTCSKTVNAFTSTRNISTGSYYITTSNDSSSQLAIGSSSGSASTTTITPDSGNSSYLATISSTTSKGKTYYTIKFGDYYVGVQSQTTGYGNSRTTTYSISFSTNGNNNSSYQWSYSNGVFTNRNYTSYQLAVSNSTLTVSTTGTQFYLTKIDPSTETTDATKTTYSNQTPTCNSGYTLENGVCAAKGSTVTVDKVCPTDYELKNGECQKNVTISSAKTCPSGYRMVNGTCQKTKCNDYTITGDNITFEEADNTAVEVRKTVTATENFQDTGLYKVEFSGRGKITSYTPYVVIVFDNSNSMNITGSYNKYMSAVNSYKTFAKDLLENNPNAQIAMVSFAGGYSNSNSASYCTKISNGTNTYSATKFGESGNYFTNGNNQYSKDEYLCLDYKNTNGNGTQATDSPFDDAVVLRDFDNSNLDDIRPPQPGTSEQFGGASSTNLYAGLYEARKLLDGVTGMKYIVVLSDGAPTTTYCVEDEPETIYKGVSRNVEGISNYGWADEKNVGGYSDNQQGVIDDTIAYANIIKENDDVKIITLAYDADTTASNTLISVSSGDNYHFDGNDENVKEVMVNISTKISDLAKSKVADIVGGDFTFDTDYKDGVSGSVFYDNVVLTEEWQELGYFYIKIDPETSDGWYYTNGGFTFAYYDSSGQIQSIQCIDDPAIWWEQKTHSYTIKYYYDDGDGYKQYDWSPDTTEDSIKLTKVGDEITTKFSVSYDEVSGEYRTSNYNYELVSVKYQDLNGVDVLKNNGKYSETMSTNDSKNVISVYYKARKTLSLQKKLKNYESDDYIKDDDTEFKFKIEFSVLPDEDDTYIYMYKGKKCNFKFEDDTNYGYITLKANESIGFINLPSDIKYTITELNTDGYVVDILCNNKNVTSIKDNILDESTSITFINIAGYELPETGSSYMLIMFIIALLCFITPIIDRLYNFYKYGYDIS